MLIERSMSINIVNADAALCTQRVTGQLVERRGITP
jgi:hypothetical protein